jgi:hypothetical protein
MERDSAVASSLTGSEAAALERVRVVSRLLDSAVRIPGTNIRFGLDPILSIVPIAGDAAGAVLSLYPVVEAYRLGASRRAIGTMVLLVAVDAVAGTVPVLGSVFDALWRANEWNYRLLERELTTT